MKIHSLIIAATCCVSFHASAANIYTQTPNGGYPSNVLGGSAWSTFTAEMNSQHTITYGTDFSNLANIQSYDAAFVNQQLDNGLTSSEATTLHQFISSGHRAVFIGENDSWPSWNGSIMNVVGGGFNGACNWDVGSPSSGNSIVSGVASVQNICGSTLASTGNPDMLFSNGFAAIYRIGSGEALVISDSNWNDDSYISRENNAVFAHNVVTWIGSPPAVVPVPAAAWLLGSGLVGLIGFSRKHKAA